MHIFPGDKLLIYSTYLSVRFQVSGSISDVGQSGWIALWVLSGTNSFMKVLKKKKKIDTAEPEGRPSFLKRA